MTPADPTRSGWRRERARMSAATWTEAWWALVDDGDPRTAQRLHLGQQFLRAGRVVDLRVGPGRASARVVDDHTTPTPVELALREFAEQDWQTVLAVLAGQVRHSARLLAGHAPDGLDAALAGSGVTVVPTRAELEVRCDCGDQVWPCRHAAALWCALADTLDADPFMLFQLRGRGRARLLDELAAVRRARSGAEQPAGVDPSTLGDRWWTTAGGALSRLGVAEPEPPRSPAGALALLGDPPGWAGRMSAWQLLHPHIRAAADWLDRLDSDAM